ncbi:MAG: hypothetical protein QN179_05055, partial [Armatimonadota bacterium]|nr:hypothetical protein [Armatimonadota bacterium]
PVEHCITMVNETAFTDNRSQWEMWKQDKDAYRAWVQDKIRARPPRQHGFRIRGQYVEEIQQLVAAGVVDRSLGERLAEDVTAEPGEASAGG